MKIYDRLIWIVALAGGLIWWWESIPSWFSMEPLPIAGFIIWWMGIGYFVVRGIRAWKAELGGKRGLK